MGGSIVNVFRTQAAENFVAIFAEVPSAAAFEANGLLDEEPVVTSVFRQEREEPEKIRIWREEQKKRLEEKGL